MTFSPVKQHTRKPMFQTFFDFKSTFGLVSNIGIIWIFIFAGENKESYENTAYENRTITNKLSRTHFILPSHLLEHEFGTGDD